MNDDRGDFGSDSHAGVHPAVLRAIASANVGQVHSYGDDPYTEAALARFREIFGDKTQVYFVFNGTAANVLAVSAINRPFEAVICARSAHLNNDECGAPERFTGCKLLSVPTVDGKLTVEAIEAEVRGRGDEHQVRPKLVSVTQATELGTVYRPEEIGALADFAHSKGMRLHMDGARLANAAAALGIGLRALTADLGVDVLTFGGTKNGLLLGEAVVFFDPRLARDFLFIRKQGMQLASKMRFLAVQFDALLSDDLWLQSAGHANAMARRLASRVGGIPGLRVTQRVEANAVFARLPREAIARVRRDYFFYTWDEALGEVRWMTSFATSEADVDGLADSIQNALAEGSHHV